MNLLGLVWFNFHNSFPKFRHTFGLIARVRVYCYIVDGFEIDVIECQMLLSSIQYV